MFKKKKWSRNYDKCIICGTTKKPHRQEGYCVSCFSKVRYEREKNKFKKYFEKYYFKNKEELNEKSKKYYKKNKKRLKKMALEKYYIKKNIDKK